MKLSHDLLTQAADWFALMRSGDASEQDRHALQCWLEVSDDHRKCWQYVESIEQRFNSATLAGAHQAEETLHAVRRQRTGRRAVLTGIALLLGTGVLSWRFPGLYRSIPQTLAVWNAQYHTDVGEIRELILQDGTQLWLSSDTALDTHIDKISRSILLHRGEILIETGKSDHRPLIVQTNNGQLSPVGTRFSVREDGNDTLVAVFDGAVELSNNLQQQMLTAGQQTHMVADSIAPPRPAERRREAWSRGVLLAEDIRLGDLISELERYRPGVIHVSPDAAALRVFGGYSLTQPDHTLATLEKALPIKVNHILPWWVNITVAE